MAIATINNDGNSYLLKFDANTNLLWKKCLPYQIKRELWATRFIKDEFKNTYIVGSYWGLDTTFGDLFILRLDSCFKKTKCVIYTDTVEPYQQFPA